MRFIAYLLAALLLGSCGKQETANKTLSPSSNTSAAPSLAAPQAKLNISGQVFVVTQGKENIKLALVEVGAIPEKDITQYLSTKHSNGLEQQKALMPELESAKKEAVTASTEANKAEKEFTSREVKVFTQEDVDAWKNAERTKGIAGAKKSTYKKIKDKYDYFDSTEYYLYLEKLPNPMAISKTDADGKFTLSLPPGKYAFAATSSRKVFKDTEYYYWLVLVDTSSPNQSLMLSNDNLFETKCKECVQP